MARSTLRARPTDEARYRPVIHIDATKAAAQFIMSDLIPLYAFPGSKPAASERIPAAIMVWAVRSDGAEQAGSGLAGLRGRVVL